MFNQLMIYLEKAKILPDTQSGFRKNYSCTTAILHILDNILAAADTNNLTVFVLLDYTKAFDCINHNLLLTILGYIGLDHVALQLLENFLINRKQIVQYKDKLSHEVTLHCGVPQGSMVGPLLFSIYISQLNKNLSVCKVHYYADDTQLYASFPPDNIEVNRSSNVDLNSVVNCSYSHSLSVNPGKTVALLFGKPALRIKYCDKLKIVIDAKQIQLVEGARNLGLILDTELHFRSHISNCIKRAFCNRNILNKYTIKLLCNTLVLSHFSFCDVV